MRPPRRNPKGAWVSRAIASLLVVDDAQDIAFLLLGARADCSCQLPGRELADARGGARLLHVGTA
jgi:hypothetical protein